MSNRFMWVASASFVALGIASTASAQTTPATPPPEQADVPAPAPSPSPAPAAATNRALYPAEFFRPFAPASALDIVRRVPGFTLETGSQDVRGFGGAAGNVVINGARPTAKDDTLETVLSRIPARRVLRVEVASGDQFGAEFSGRAQVLNLVLSAERGVAINADAELRRDFSGQLTPQGSVSALLRRGASTFNASVGYNNRHTPEEGTDTVITLPAGTLVERRVKYNDIFQREGFVSGSWALDHGANRQAHLNGRFSTSEFELNQTNDVFPTGGTVRDDRLSQFYRRDSFEIGGDVTRPLLGGGIKLIGLATRRTRDDVDTSFNRVQSQVVGGFVQDANTVLDERVLRLVWSRSRANGWSVEAGAEGAFNRLDSDVQLFSVGAGDVRTRIDLPIDQAVVSEFRGEVFLNVGRNLARNFRLDAGLTLEASHLTVTGDAEAERTLRFLKPRLVLDWRPGDGWHTQLTLQRTVAQLDFFDFISVAELTNDRVSGGNADLLPQRAWEALLTVERPILGSGAAKLELGYQHIELVQDRVPTPEGFDAPGNLGNGRLAFIRATLDAPLDRIGIKGGRLTVNGTLQDTSVEDPYTHRPRAFSGTAEWQLEAHFRQDRGKFAWGLDYFGSSAQRFYRLNEIDAPDGQEPFVQLFAEYRRSARTTFTLTAENIFEVAGTRGRTFFSPDRSNPVPSLFEFRERNAHVAFTLRLRHSFG